MTSKSKVGEKYRIKKETYVNNYGIQSFRFVPQKRDWFWWSDCYEDCYDHYWYVYFDTEEEAREYIEKESKFETLIKEEII